MAVSSPRPLGGYPCHGFLLTDGNFTTIDFPGAFQTVAYGINNAGDIVGRYDEAPYGTGIHGFLYSYVDKNFITIEFPDALDTWAYGINNAGKIVGEYADTPFTGHSFVYIGGTFTTLDFPGSPRGINNAGNIVGYYTGATATQGFLASPANQPPVALCQNVSVPAGSSCTANASVDKGSHDPEGDLITLTQSPVGPYPKGDTLVTLTVTDSQGLSSQCTGTVTVNDNTPPTLTCPVPQAIDAMAPYGAISSFSPTVSDNCPGTAVSCTPASGSVFPIGVTSVSCSATDGSANSSSCSFTVTVRGAADQTNNLITLVKSFNLPKGISNTLVSELSQVVRLLAAGKTKPACNVVNEFIADTLAQRGKKITKDEANQLITNAMRIKAAAGCR